jgi:hypothetical protein
MRGGYNVLAYRNDRRNEEEA